MNAHPYNSIIVYICRNISLGRIIVWINIIIINTKYMMKNLHEYSSV